MSNILVPGRHHLLSVFQHDYLSEVLNTDINNLKDVHGNPLKITQPFDTIIWPVTSANHSNTRRNPLPGNRREVAIESFSANIKATTFVYMIDDLGSTKKFAEYVAKKIESDSMGRHVLTPENTVVAVSTPSVIKMWEELGFQILPLELKSLDPEEYSTERTWELVEDIVASHENGIDWRKSDKFLYKVAPASKDIYLRYNYGDLIIDLFSDPILGADGDLTDTRDYTTYVRSFDEGAKRKYELIKDFIKPGRIVDIGCATGSILKEMSYDDNLREADLYGVEVSRKLYTLCVQRKENGEFANDNIFFYQRNIIENKVFRESSINTFTSFSLTHELESYAGRETLLSFLRNVYEQLTPGGVYINVDVIGPENPEDIVYAWFSSEDGVNEGWDKEFEDKKGKDLEKFLNSLSTLARFKRFAQDFRQEEGYKIQYEIENIDGKEYVKGKLGDIQEFLSKKDFTDNWYSEMHETFCFWSFSDWKKELENTGFRLLPESSLHTNEWIVENRYKNKAKLFKRDGNELKEISFPDTNVILVAEKI